MYVAKLGDLYFKSYKSLSPSKDTNINIEFTNDFKEAYIFKEIDNTNSAMSWLLDMNASFYNIYISPYSIS